jgi:hypothetical protein
VVLPDDPAFYGGTPKDSFSGARKQQVELAAAMILTTSPHFASGFEVQVAGNSGAGPLTATVRANFHCFAGWVSLVCGAGTRQLTARASGAYHAAPYSYDL